MDRGQKHISHGFLQCLGHGWCTLILHSISDHRIYLEGISMSCLVNITPGQLRQLLEQPTW